MSKQHNESCLILLKYDEIYDAWYCPACNEWAEKQCSDPRCEYCANRPNRPFDPLDELVNEAQARGEYNEASLDTERLSEIELWDKGIN